MKTNNMHGAIIVNKAPNMTSRDVINILNKKFNTKSIGHTGTLDPIAEGVLVCLIGKYTKLTDILINHDKEYIASFKLGILTDTLDITGKILKEEKVNLTKEEIQKTILSFKGTYNQEVPIYSAVKINGKKLYEYARNNEEIPLPKRKVNIYDIELLNIDNECLTIKTKVSKGTYIRSLIRDIGLKLNTNATMTKLIRTKLDKFTIEESYTLEDIQNDNYKILSLEDLIDLDTININEEMLFKIKNGQIIDYQTNKYILYKYNNQNIALYKPYQNNKIKPFIMF